MSHQDEETKPVQKTTYTYDDLTKFQNAEAYSSIGKMNISTKATAPSYGFGTSNRQKLQKVYQSEELSRVHFVGKVSPGPNYEVRHTDKYYYDDDPKWSFGRDIRNTLNTGPKHAHYNRPDVDFDPIQADNSRKWRSASVKVGLESRFADPSKRTRMTPGPDYDPSLKPEVPIAPKYSFGVRREIRGASPLVLLISTPNQVGPGSYIKQGHGNTSTMPDHPLYSFTKDKKHRPTTTNIQKNQTYDTRSSLGMQPHSINKTMPTISIGKARRDVQTGMFKGAMTTQPTKLRIAHPKF